MERSAVCAGKTLTSRLSTWSRIRSGTTPKIAPERAKPLRSLCEAISKLNYPLIGDVALFELIFLSCEVGQI